MEEGRIAFFTGISCETNPIRRGNRGALFVPNGRFKLSSASATFLKAKKSLKGE